MSNNCSFHLWFQSDDREELETVRDFLQHTPWPWILGDIERRLPPDDGFRFRGSVQADESATGHWLSGEEGLLAELLNLFSKVRVRGSFRDQYGHGTLDDLEKDYDQHLEPAADDEDGEDGREMADLDSPEDVNALFPPGLLLVASGTPLAEDDADFSTRLEQIAELLGNLGARELGATLVEEETLEWTVSGEGEPLTPEQAEILCRGLRELRLPLDTRVSGPAGGLMNIWPVQNRPWRTLF